MSKFSPKIEDQQQQANQIADQTQEQITLLRDSGVANLNILSKLQELEDTLTDLGKELLPRLDKLIEKVGSNDEKAKKD